MDALVLGQDGRIEAVGTWRDLRGRVCCDVTDARDLTLAPGLVNAHTHLQLSHLDQGLTLGQGFVPWVRSLAPRLRDPLLDESLETALAQVLNCGTAFVADITSRQCGRVARAMVDAGLDFWLLLEAFGFEKNAGTGVLEECLGQLPGQIRPRVAAAGHAPYSTSPDVLRAAKQWSTEHGMPFSIHLAEPEGEAELLRTGSGELAEFYARAGILPPNFQPPGLSAVSYADSLGLLDSRTLAVHCVHVDKQDIGLLQERKANVCLCPRSNARMAVGRAPWEALLDSGVNVCLGTDGLTSNADLNLWNELRFVRDGCASPVDLIRALSLVTVNPARALGVEHAYGTTVPGRRAVFSILPADMAAWSQGQAGA